MQNEKTTNTFARTAVAGVAVLVVAAGVFIYLEHPEWFSAITHDAAWRAAQEKSVADIIAAGDIGACDGVSYASSDGMAYDAVCRNNIAWNQALKTLDVVWCQKLDDKLMLVADCERAVVFEKMRATKNAAACDSASTPVVKNSCLLSFWLGEAETAGRADLCYNMADSIVKQACFDSFIFDNLTQKPLTLDCNLASRNLQNDCKLIQSAVKASSITEQAKFCDDVANAQLALICPTIKE